MSTTSCSTGQQLLFGKAENSPSGRDLAGNQCFCKSVMLPMRCLCRGPFCHLPPPHSYIQPGFFISSLAALCLESAWPQQWQVVTQLRPCQKNATARLTSAGSHLPYLSLWSPFFTSVMPSHIPHIETSLSPPSLLSPGHQSLLSALFSPVTLHILGDQALLLAEQS